MNPNPLLLLILSACALPATSGQACIDVSEDATSCPAAADVDVGEAFVPLDCDQTQVNSVSGDGTLEERPSQVVDTATSDLVCCYDAELIDTTPNSDCMVGRPLPGGVQAQPVGPGTADEHARAWVSAGLGEHASVAAFAKLALELMAHGAPMALVRDVLEAAGDEIAHTEACFSRAGGGRPGPLPVSPFDPHRSLAAIAQDAVRDGCITETLGALAARAVASEPGVVDTFSMLAADEERHAALSWRVVAWAVRAGGPEVRQAVRRAFQEPVRPVDVAPLALRSGVDPAMLDRAVRAGLVEVVQPAARALLAA